MSTDTSTMSTDTDTSTGLRLDERALRKPSFRADVSITLADGQDWYFPRPFLMYQPGDDDDQVIQHWSVGQGDEYASLLRAVQGAKDNEESARAEFRAIKYLLRLNYNLQPADFRGLLVLDYSGVATPDIARMSEEIRDLLYGRVPAKKASGDGSA